MHKRIAFILVASLSLCAACVISACHSSGSSAAAHAATIPSARVAVAKQGDVSQEITLAGEFQPYQVVDVHPKVSGYMEHIYVDIGDIVHQGETIAVLEVPELAAQLQATVFQLQQAKEEIVRAQREINRTQALHAALHAEWVRLKRAAATRPGLIAQQELDDAQAQDLSSQAKVDAAEAALAAAQQHAQSAKAENERLNALESYTNVTAPLNGVVIWRYADTGALIQGSTNSNTTNLPIVRIAQSQLLRLRIPVPEDDVHFIHIGLPLQVHVDAVNRNFVGKVVRFTREVDFQTRTMETEIDVPNQNLSIDSGMYADVLLPLSQAKNVVTIPLGAVALNAQQMPTAYVLDSHNHVHIRPITLGVKGALLAAVESGLKPGDRVIDGGMSKYQSGEEVQPILVTTPASETQTVTGGTIDLAQTKSSGSVF